MPSLRFIALDSETVKSLRNGGKDAHGQEPERQVSDGGGNPCRHCLEDMPEGAPFLVLAHRPFPDLQPYAEVGPLFVHAEDCTRYPETAGPPAYLKTREAILIRGYGTDNRILYGTGQIVPPEDIEAISAKLFEDPKIAYIHVRSASNNCYQCRIERG
ncbi:DUF1203 domain-containing protein [Pelagibius litoralis]|uniref:DUF1203 domain-containing protein n=1 Tax=Pelagibius litoralis TaxID=374515 RepID=A0A967KCV0_9PROT|nr:DUF1203 domain-containing protein [Pelagibius litoralis]NIA69870.1 DUF1203 domain-containing protein [Pelagibius litoralis]